MLACGLLDYDAINREGSYQHTASVFNSTMKMEVIHSSFHGWRWAVHTWDVGNSIKDCMASQARRPQLQFYQCEKLKSQTDFSCGPDFCAQVTLSCPCIIFAGSIKPFFLVVTRYVQSISTSCCVSCYHIVMFYNLAYCVIYIV